MFSRLWVKARPHFVRWCVIFLNKNSMARVHSHVFLVLVLVLNVTACVGFAYRELKLPWTRIQRARGTVSSSTGRNPVDHGGFGSKIELSIKLPTNDKQMAQSFISSTDYLVESMFKNAKKVTPTGNTYLVRVRPTPLPLLGIVSPEIEVYLENRNGALHVRSDKWSLKDGAGLSLQDKTIADSLDLTLRGLLRIVQQRPNSKAGESDNIVPGVFVKRPVGGFPIFAEGFVEYRVTGRSTAAGGGVQPSSSPSSSLLSGTAAAIMQKAADHFLSYGLSKKLTRACKDYVVAAVARDLSA